MRQVLLLGYGQYSWFNDYSEFASTLAPWLERGGSAGDGSAAGLNAFSRGDGGIFAHRTFRVTVSR